MDNVSHHIRNILVQCLLLFLVRAVFTNFSLPFGIQGLKDGSAFGPSIMIAFTEMDQIFALVISGSMRLTRLRALITLPENNI